MKKLLLFVFALFITSLVIEVQAREVIPFNRDWRISKSLKDNQPSKVVNLPHTWNSESITNTLDEQRGGYYYTKKFEAPDSWTNKKLFIRFNGVASVASLFVNGKYVGEHKGAFTAFTFDITPFIRKGGSNTIVLNVDNSVRNDVFPLAGDYRIYGGIYRDVELIVTDKFHITPLHFSTNGVYVTQNSLNNREAEIGLHIITAGQYGDKGRVRTTIFDGERAVASSEEELSIGLEGEKELKFNLNIKNPKRWHGKTNPFMYRCLVEIMDANGKVVDKVTEHFGLRTIYIDRNKGFMLNDESYPLRGVTYREDWSNIHSALRGENRRKDISIINEIGASAVRCADYPHSNKFYDLTDRNGIVTWVDMPFSGDIMGHNVSFINSTSLIANGDVQLQEMLFQLYNHPSVAFIGLFSNIAGYADTPIQFVETLNERVKAINPNVLTVGCSNEDGALNSITDAISWSQYFGWHTSKASDVSLWLNNFKTGWKKIYPAIGEYGAGGSVFHQDEKVSVVNDGAGWYPESSQTDFHITYNNALKDRPYMWGVFVNSMFDYGVTFNSEGDINDISNMGLVTYDRVTMKDAFYLYKANWNKAEKFIHITQKRDRTRSNRRQDIVLFSSCPTVDVVVNGMSQSTLTVDNGVAVIKSLYLNEGKNTILVRSGDISDSINITIEPNSFTK